jgi:hypothetical protein
MASPKYRGDWQQVRTTYWLPKVQAGGVCCWRCGRPIVHNPAVRGGGWDVGHRDHLGLPPAPEHARQCNRSKGGRVGAMITNSRRPRRRPVRPAVTRVW